MKNAFYLLTLLLPWPVRRRVLGWAFHYDLHPTSRIGLAWIVPETLVMGAHSRIGHLTLCKGLARLQIGAYGTIGRGNWITGFPRRTAQSAAGGHFAHQPEREPSLTLGEHCAITNRHLIDCTNSVTLGRFTTLAGFQSQILTHSIDIERGCQSSAPVEIGEYCFVGTNVVILGGSVLPSYSVLGAKSLLSKPFTETYTLYAGVPAKSVKKLSSDSGYFRRTAGFVV